MLVWAAVEILAVFGLFYLKNNKILYSPLQGDGLRAMRQAVLKLLSNETRYILFSPTLGWTIKPEARSGFLGWEDTPPFVRSNSQGMRADRDYTPAPLPGKIRIAAFGDSLTHCDDVENADTWEEALTRLYPGAEVLNFGVPAYGLDQAFLRYLQDGLAFHPNIVLIGFHTDDIKRHVNVFHPFAYPGDQFPLTKPRFAVRDNRMVLIKNPFTGLADYQALIADPQAAMKRLGQNDYFYPMWYYKGPADFLPSVRLIRQVRYLIKRRGNIFTSLDHSPYGFINPSSEAFAVTAGLFNAFYDAVLDQGAVPVILLFPSVPDLKYAQRGKPPHYVYLKEYLDSRGMRYIDVLDGFMKYYRQEDFPRIHTERSGRHYSEAANSAVAQTIYDYFKTHGLDDLSKITRKAEEEKAAGTKRLHPPKEGTHDSNP